MQTKSTAINRNETKMHKIKTFFNKNKNNLKENSQLVLNSMRFKNYYNFFFFRLFKKQILCLKIKSLHIYIFFPTIESYVLTLFSFSFFVKRKLVFFSFFFCNKLMHVGKKKKKHKMQI